MSLYVAIINTILATTTYILLPYLNISVCTWLYVGVDMIGDRELHQPSKSRVRSRCQMSQNYQILAQSRVYVSGRSKSTWHGDLYTQTVDFTYIAPYSQSCMVNLEDCILLQQLTGVVYKIPWSTFTCCLCTDNQYLSLDILGNSGVPNLHGQSSYYLL